jgi:N-alpha-acetyl-L-2,4-diaminobutyrate deacetylase
VLIRAGILNGELQLSPTVYLKQDDGACFITSEHDGLFKFVATLMVKKGDVVVVMI